MTGFLEESPGVRSMSRLTILWMSILATVIVALICWYVLAGKTDAAMVCALGGALLTVVAKGAAAIITRNGGKDES